MTGGSSGRPGGHELDIVMATLMRTAGGSGVQSHVRAFADYLRDSTRTARVVSPFSSSSPLLPPVFGARFGVGRVSRPAGCGGTATGMRTSSNARCRRT